jgi:hypothetical protein
MLELARWLDSSGYSVERNAGITIYWNSFEEGNRWTELPRTSRFIVRRHVSSMMMMMMTTINLERVISSCVRVPYLSANFFPKTSRRHEK